MIYLDNYEKEILAYYEASALKPVANEGELTCIRDAARLTLRPADSYADMQPPPAN
jgi:hypothetical protein